MYRRDDEKVQYRDFTHFLFTILACAHRMRVHFCPKLRLLCRLGLYSFEFEDPKELPSLPSFNFNSPDYIHQSLRKFLKIYSKSTSTKKSQKSRRSYICPPPMLWFFVKRTNTHAQGRRRLLSFSYNVTDMKTQPCFEPRIRWKSCNRFMAHALSFVCQRLTRSG